MTAASLLMHQSDTAMLQALYQSNHAANVQAYAASRATHQQAPGAAGSSSGRSTRRRAPARLPASSASSTLTIDLRRNWKTKGFQRVLRTDKINYRCGMTNQCNHLTAKMDGPLAVPL